MKHIGYVDSNLTGSGFQSLQLARELGLRVTFLTRSLDEYLKIPGNRELFDACVDQIVFYETNDSDSVLAAIEREVSTPFDAIMTVSDYHVPVAAGVARKLGLPGLNPEAAHLARNKQSTREKCLQANVPAPKFTAVETLEEALAAADSIGYPCVVKPVDESASHGVVMCMTPLDVEIGFRNIQDADLNTRNQQRVKRVLIEEYLMGYEVSVEVVALPNGEFHVLGVTDKKVTGTPYFVEMSHTFPSAMPDALFEACQHMAIQALKAIGFDFGPAHVELKITKDGPKLIEINARTAGDHITDLVEFSIGVPYLLEMMKMFLGEMPNLTPAKQSGAAIHFLTALPGVIRDVRGLELAQASAGVKELAISAKPGGEVRRLKSNRDRLGYVITVSATPYEADRLADAALQQIQVDTVQS